MGKSTINGPVSIAILVYQRVVKFGSFLKGWFPPSRHHDGFNTTIGFMVNSENPEETNWGYLMLQGGAPEVGEVEDMAAIYQRVTVI